MSKKTVIPVIIIVLGIAGYLFYLQIGKRHAQSRDGALEVERELKQQRIETLEEQVSSLEEQLEEREDRRPAREKLAEVFGEAVTTVVPGDEELSCEESERKIAAFFSHLDKQAYAQTHGFREGSYELFRQTITRLSEMTPEVTGEMVELTALMRNIAYFYRTLGKKRVDLIREVLKNEADIMESVLAAFYQWTVCCDRSGRAAKECPSLETLYEYAGFFLTTFAGRSYLMRRSSHLRILVSYYCVLIVDRANDETLNRHGIDLKPSIDLLYSEIRNSRGLLGAKRYVEKLSALDGKYQR